MSSGIRIDVTEGLIAKATQRDSRHCMIAEAIKEAKPHFRKVMVDLQTIRWTNPRTQKRYIVLTPEHVGLALVAFDQAEPIEPFSIRLKPVQVTPIPVRQRRDDQPVGARGERAYQKRTERGRKRLNDQLVTEGGKPLPVGHLGNVRVSRNDVRVYGRRLLRA